MRRRTSRRSAKAASIFDKPLFPETRRELFGPTPGSAEEEAISKHDEKIKNQAILTALRMAGIGLLAGGGTRLLQEGWNRFLGPRKGVSDRREITLDIHRPGRKKRRRTKRAQMESVEDWPFYYPLAVGGMGLGLYGGYQGMRGLADWLKKRELESELDAAKQEFEEALDEQYAASRRKFASLNATIDSAYEKWLAGDEGMSKQADWWGKLGGLGIGTAALIWLLSHKAAYSRLKKSDPESFRKSILEHQRRIRQAVSPPPIVFEYPEEEEKRKSKAAAADVLPGGLAAGKDEKDIAEEHGVSAEQIEQQLEQGTEVEKEHTSDEATAREIAKDHTAEDPKYYDPHLEEMEEEAETELDIAGPEPLKEEPQTGDVASILNFVANSANLDDEAVHEQILRQGIQPDEGEEVIYSALQDALNGKPVDPATVREREPEEEEEAEASEDKEENELGEGEGDNEKEAAAAAHSCGQCEYFNGGTCVKQDDVIESVGEDNLTIFLSNPTKTNSCPAFEKEADEPAVEVPEGVKEALLKSANGQSWGQWAANTLIGKPGMAAMKGLADWSGATDWAKQKALSDPDVQRNIVGAASQAANDPQTLAPAAEAMAGDTNFQEGMNQGAMRKVQAIPMIGSLFGK